ncbi:hypothetical protein [Pararhodonellum marinum]|uniref:hypothetical protein n=1 Tax=Pararhodonellum marinum TaxID=2755358 RepID=UPI00188FB41C|nr:hypothetical protein [Pararhodonellum marinum]
MRTLSENEIQSIKTRLNLRLIAYQEIYDELLDHYVTALEQVAPEEFASKVEALDNEFAWSVVRGMEKELLSSVSHQIQNSQLAALKIWKLDWWKVLGIFTYTFFLVMVYQFISLDVMLVFSILPVVGILVALLYHSGNSISFSRDPKNHRPKNVILQAALGRYVLIFNFLNAFFMVTATFLNIHGFESWAMVLMICYTTILNIYALSLYGCINLRTFKLIKS